MSGHFGRANPAPEVLQTLVAASSRSSMATSPLRRNSPHIRSLRVDYRILAATLAARLDNLMDIIAALEQRLVHLPTVQAELAPEPSRPSGFAVRIAAPSGLAQLSAKISRRPHLTRLASGSPGALECAGANIMAKKITRVMWSMKTDREWLALSRTRTLEALADHFHLSHAASRR